MPESSLLDLLVDLATIATGVVLASAGLYALMLQRSRFVREITPDIRIEEADVLLDFRSRGDKTEFVTFKLEIKNRSAVGGERLLVGIMRDLWPTPDDEVRDIEIAGEGELALVGTLESGEERTVLVGMAVPNSNPMAAQIFLRLDYSSKREFAVLLLNPLSKGRLRFSSKRPFLLNRIHESQHEQNPPFRLLPQDR